MDRGGAENTAEGAVRWSVRGALPTPVPLCVPDRPSRILLVQVRSPSLVWLQCFLFFLSVCERLSSQNPNPHLISYAATGFTLISLAHYFTRHHDQQAHEGWSERTASKYAMARTHN